MPTQNRLIEQEWGCLGTHSGVTALLDQQKRHTPRHRFFGFVVVCDGMLLAAVQLSFV
jgi:hypothetical protein